MDSSLMYFMLAADDQSIPTAARRAYISVQGMSNHIKKLEQEYGVTLFRRKPRFMLTSEGYVLYEYAKKLQIMENNVQEQIHDVKKGLRGTITFGVDVTRGHLLMEKVYPSFHSKFPEVKLHMATGFTPDLVPQLFTGEMSIFFGPYWYDYQELKKIHVMKESYQYIISGTLGREFFGDEWEETSRIWTEQGADIRQVTKIPVVLTSETSYMNQKITEFLRLKQIRLKVAMQSNIHLINLEMASRGSVACFCPSMISNYYLNHGGREGPFQDLTSFPIRGFHEAHDISLVYYANSYMPLYVRQYMREICNLLGDVPQDI